MIRSVVGTVGTRVAVTVLNLVVVMAAGHSLGASGVGAISLIVLGAAMVLLAMNVVAGGGSVYLTPRFGTEHLRWPAYTWTVLMAVVGYLVLTRVPLVPSDWIVPVLIIALVQGVINTHLGLLLGQQRIAVHNGILILQSAILAVVFIVLLHMDGAGVEDYIRAAYTAHGTTALLSGVLSFRYRSIGSYSFLEACTQLFRQGIPAQTANTLQLINYRFAYLLVERAQGMAGLGLFSVTTQLAEGTWLVPKSIGMVVYTRVSNSEARKEQMAMVLTAVKASVAATALSTTALLLVPDTIYQWLFGTAITGITPILLVMAPGLLAMAASQPLSHFLSGTGGVMQNAWSSGIGAVITLAVGVLAIPVWGLLGAALTSSCAHLVSVLYQWHVFQRSTGAEWRALLPASGDRQALGTLWRRVLGR